MSELMVAIALLCQLNGSYQTSERLEIQKECQKKLAKCVEKNINRASVVLLECVAKMETK